MRKLSLGLTAIACAAAFSAWSYARLPAEIATHFDFEGHPNGFSSRLFAALFVPALGVVVAFTFTVLPRIDPRAANYAKFGAAYWTIANAVLVVLASLHVASLGKALGWPVDIRRIATIGVGGVFVLFGLVMKRIQPNWFMGIRTPWTLSSDTVWRKTHQFGGMAFVIAGVCIAALSLVTSGGMLQLVIVAAMVAALSPVVYSYFAWRREQGASASQRR
jgi:uncharacterized membrane protein